MGPLACLPGGNTILEARATRGPKPEGYPPICENGKGFISNAKAKCHASNTENDYLVLLTPHCFERDMFLPFNTMKFGSQDDHMKQPQKTLVYTKALQHWAENTQPPMPGEPHQFVECVWELREAMGPLMTFKDKEVLSSDVPGLT